LKQRALQRDWAATLFIHSVHRRSALALALNGMVVQRSWWHKFLTLLYLARAWAVTSAPEKTADVISR